MEKVSERDAVEDYEKIPGEGLTAYMERSTGKIVVSGEDVPGRERENFTAVYDPQTDGVSLSGSLTPETFLLAADFVYRHRLKLMREDS